MHWTTGKSAFDFCQKREFFILFKASRLFSHEVNKPWHDADQLPLSNTMSTALQTFSTSTLQYIPPRLFGIENNCLIHEHCKHLYICITAYTPPGFTMSIPMPTGRPPTNDNEGTLLNPYLA
jgi:hypothetical protein